MVAAAAPPASRYAAQRTWRARPALPARVQLGLSRVQPAWTATAATAAPAPAPAPFTHSGGVPARNSADSARMQASPGRMKASPPASAPTRPRTRQAQKIASSVEAGPGSRLHAAMASSNSSASSHCLRSTHSCRSSAMCAGGPPKPMHPIRPHSRTTVPRPARCSTATPRGGRAGSRSGSAARPPPGGTRRARPPRRPGRRCSSGSAADGRGTPGRPRGPGRTT